MSSHPSPSVSAWPKLIPFSSRSSLDVPEVRLDYAFVLVGCIVFAYVYLLPKGYNALSIFGRKLYNKDGYAIPNGPFALPVVGRSSCEGIFVFVPLLKQSSISRVVPVPFALSGAHAGLLVQKVRSSVLSLAWKPAFCYHHRPGHHERPVCYQWCSLLQRESKFSSGSK